MMPIEDIESHSILPDLVRRGGLVLDCGANLGAFSMEMIGFSVSIADAMPSKHRQSFFAVCQSIQI
jgi:fatty acid/phospholipid biosynthesis enzyme